VGEIVRAVRTQEQARPKTALAFFGTAVVAVIGGLPLTLWVLASKKDLQHLVPWVLVLAFLLVVAILGGVYMIVWRDPTRLQVTQMTGPEYTEYQRLTIGDSVAGDELSRDPQRVRTWLMDLRLAPS
jgi:apolipoprotein N-acyltransferase